MKKLLTAIFVYCFAMGFISAQTTYEDCSYMNPAQTIQCNNNYYWYPTSGAGTSSAACKIDTGANSIASAKAACVSTTDPDLGTNGYAPKITRTWNCGCTSVSSCNSGLQNCGGTCQSAAPQNNTCPTGQTPTGYDFCTGAVTGCQDIAMPTCQQDEILQHDGTFWACATLGSLGGGKFTDGDVQTSDAKYDAGDVGIGLGDPQYPLHVQGSVNFDNRTGGDFFFFDADTNMGVFSNAGLFLDASYLGINPSGQMTTMNVGSLALDVEGNIGAQKYCDETGAKCMDVSACSANQVLMYNGTNWACSAMSGGSGGKFVDGNDPANAVYTGGKVGIGTTNPSEALHVVGDVYIHGDSVNDGTPTLKVGALTDDGIVEAREYIYSSDRRLKKNITSLDSSDTLAKVKQLNPVSYDWRSNNESDMGFIAQEVQAVFPSLVHGSEEDYYAVSYGKFVSVLTAAIQEQQKQIEALEERIVELEAKKK